MTACMGSCGDGGISFALSSVFTFASVALVNNEADVGGGGGGVGGGGSHGRRLVGSRPVVDRLVLGRRRCHDVTRSGRSSVAVP